MNIEWTLYEEEGIDPIDLLGEIVLTDGQTTFRVEATYIDSWFEALIAGIKAIAAGNKLTVEVVEEPEPLIFEPGDGTMKILYQGQALKINDIDEVVDSLKKSARTLIEQLNGLTGMEKIL